MNKQAFLADPDVEDFLRWLTRGKSGDQLPVLLTFPATTESRTVRRRFPRARSPGVMAHGAPETAGQWPGAKVRLGWIMGSVLGQLPGLFSGCCPAPSLADRMQVFETSLFMVGYDVGYVDCTR